MMRIGQGYDLHRVVSDRALRLGGVSIPWDLGLQGHSDADVLTHAIIDAVLGALALGDIGQWFPDTEPAYKGCSSIELLETVLADPRVQHWSLINLDATVVAEAPKLASHISMIAASVAACFHVPSSCISVKAKTNEGAGPVGRMEAIAAEVVLLLKKK